MTITLIFKIAVVGIIVSLLGHVIENAGGKKEYSMLVTLCGLILVLYWVIPYITDLFQSIQTLLNLQ